MYFYFILLPFFFRVTENRTPTTSPPTSTFPRRENPNRVRTRDHSIEKKLQAVRDKQIGAGLRSGEVMLARLNTSDDGRLLFASKLHQKGDLRQAYG